MHELWIIKIDKSFPNDDNVIDGGTQMQFKNQSVSHEKQQQL